MTMAIKNATPHPTPAKPANQNTTQLHAKQQQQPSTPIPPTRTSNKNNNNNLTVTPSNVLARPGTSSRGIGIRLTDTSSISPSSGGRTSSATPLSSSTVPPLYPDINTKTNNTTIDPLALLHKRVRDANTMVADLFGLAASSVVIVVGGGGGGKHQQQQQQKGQNETKTEAVEKAREIIGFVRRINAASDSSSGAAHKQLQSEYLDLSIFSLMSVGSVYTLMGRFEDALRVYKICMELPMFVKSEHRTLLSVPVLVNLGVLYYQRDDYLSACKMWRKAYDHLNVQTLSKHYRASLVHNIATAYARSGKWSKAIRYLDIVLGDQEGRRMRAMFHKLVCVKALHGGGGGGGGGVAAAEQPEQQQPDGSIENLFQMLVNTPQSVITTASSASDPVDYYDANFDDSEAITAFKDVARHDRQHALERSRQTECEWTVVSAARLLSVDSDDMATKFNECVAIVRQSKIFSHLVDNLEIAKAVTFLKRRDFSKAVQALKSFQNQDTQTYLASAAATNLTFYYLCIGEADDAEASADRAVNANRYNACALVNRGCCKFVKFEYEKARESFEEALKCDGNRYEAIYNTGLCEKLVGNYGEALESFKKLHQHFNGGGGIGAARINNGNLTEQIAFQTANCYELMQERSVAIEEYQKIISMKSVADPYLLQRIGRLYDELGDVNEAYNFYTESYQMFAANVDVLQWLVYYSINFAKLPDKAIGYLRTCQKLEPASPTYGMMMAICLKLMGELERALEQAKQVHDKYPLNIKALAFMIKIGEELHLVNEVEVWNRELASAQRMEEARTRTARMTAATRRGGGSTSVQSQPSASPNERRSHLDKTPLLDLPPHRFSSNSTTPTSPLGFPITSTSPIDSEQSRSRPQATPLLRGPDYADPLQKDAHRMANRPLTQAGRPKTARGSGVDNIGAEFDALDVFGDNLFP